MSHQSQQVTFHAACPEPRAWLVLTSANRESHVLEMSQHDGTDWSVSADLAPGDYRCRYYGGDDRHVTYYGAASTAGSIECGMDSLVLIRNPQDKPAIPFLW